MKAGEPKSTFRSGPMARVTRLTLEGMGMFGRPLHGMQLSVKESLDRNTKVFVSMTTRWPTVLILFLSSQLTTRLTVWFWSSSLSV